jgi:glyoxylase-like metal-dependent hydrolase (beta-lactamase superfamily II)
MPYDTADLGRGGTIMQDRHIGDVRVTRIEEQLGPGFPAKDFFPEFEAETFAGQQHWLAPGYYQPESGRLVTSIHSWLVRTGKYTILIDACSGNHKPRPGMPRFDMLNTKYLDRLREAGVQPEEIDFVMCTHLHVDHVGWNTRLENGKWVPTFPNAKYVMSHTDHDHWAALAKKPDTETYQINTYNDSVLPIVEAKKAEFVSGEHGMCGCFTLKPAPGHTPGQIRVDLDSRGKRAIFAGDALHNPVQVPLWKWNSCFCEDRDLARKSRNTLLADCVEQGALLMPAHFASPHAAYVRAAGDRFELDWDFDNARGRLS